MKPLTDKALLEEYLGVRDSYLNGFGKESREGERLTPIYEKEILKRMSYIDKHNDLKKDLIFMLEQSFIIEHKQDYDGIVKLRKKYKVEI